MTTPFFSEQIISTNADEARSVYTADVDGDGDIDVLSASSGDNKIAWYENNGSEGFTERIISTNADGASSVYVADVDGDGDIDIVSTAYCFFNPGGDMTDLWTVSNIDPYWNSDDAYSWEYNATKIFCADIDHDNRDEVFISCSEKFRSRRCTREDRSSRQSDQSLQNKRILMWKCSRDSSVKFQCRSWVLRRTPRLVLSN